MAKNNGNIRGDGAHDGALRHLHQEIDGRGLGPCRFLIEGLFTPGEARYSARYDRRSHLRQLPRNRRRETLGGMLNHYYRQAA